jgi:AAA family ATP:ADP antiporter
VTTPQVRSTADARAAAAAVAACTTIITFQLAGKATRDALFLSTFSVAYLPAMEIAAAALSAVVTVGMARVMVQRGPGRLIPRMFALSALLLLAEWALVLQARQPAAVLVYFHYSALGALLVSGFWAIVNERFDPRTARRAIGRITAGGSIGGLLGGLLSERVGAALPLTVMLPILAGLHFLAAALVLRVDGGHAPASAHVKRQQGEPMLPAGRVLRTSSYLIGIALLVALTSAAEGVLDYVFKARAAAATASGEELLRLFAAFYTGTALLGIFIQVSVLRRILARRGVAQSVSILPAGVSVSAIGAFLVPGLVPVMMARGVELVLRNSVFRAAYELLFSPVAPGEKRATKLLLDVGAARVGDVVGGALILTALALGAGAGRVLLAVTVALSIAAIVVARRLRLGYVAALEGSLQRRAADFPDPIRDDVAALLQTVGGFDLSGIRSRPSQLTGERSALPAEHPSPAGVSHYSPLRRAVSTGDPEVIRQALEAAPLTADLIEPAIELLAWDRVAPHAIQALQAAARPHTALLIRHLLDSEEDFAIRRRLVSVLADFPTIEAFNGLFDAMRDRRFEVRFRAARGLSHLAGEIPHLQVDRERVFGVVLREMAVERGLWESRQLIDLPDDESSPMEAEVLRDRASRSLEHLFTLLSLVFPRETLRLAFHGLHTDDPYLRGTALEYLETVLPESIWERLWPFLNAGEEYTPRRGRGSGQAVQELLASRDSIMLALGEARRLGRPRGQR